MPLVVVRKARPSYVDVPVPEPALRREYTIATRHEPRFARSFLRLVRGLLTKDVKKDLLVAIRLAAAGDATIEDVVAVVPWWSSADPLAEKLWAIFAANMEDAYTEIIEDAGESEFRHQGWPLKFEVQKQIRGDPSKLRVPLNPFSIRWIRDRAAKLVREVSVEQQATLRAILAKGFEEGRRPISILQEIEDTVGLLVREWQAVAKRNELLASTGMPEAARRTAVAKYTKQLLRNRAERIARTETISAYTKGLEDSWQLASEDGVIAGEQALKEWVELTASPRTCKICEKGNNGLGGQLAPLGKPFVSAIIGEIDRPPAHPH